jgi:hypothetical protein
MPTRDEIQAQMDALNAQLADLDENDYECEVEKDGTRTRVRGKTARSWLTKIGLVDEPADGADGDGADGGAGDGQDSKPKKTGTKFFD